MERNPMLEGLILSRGDSVYEYMRWRGEGEVARAIEICHE